MSGRHTPRAIRRATRRQETAEDQATLDWLARLRRRIGIWPARRAWTWVAAWLIVLAQARDGEPRCGECRCRLDAACEHPCCQPGKIISFHGTLTEQDVTTFREKFARSIGPNAWLPATPQNPGRPDVDNLDDTGAMARLTDWAHNAPISEVTGA